MPSNMSTEYTAYQSQVIDDAFTVILSFIYLARISYKKKSAHTIKVYK